MHDWIIRPQLLRVPGVVEVNPIGGFKKEILVAPDPVEAARVRLSRRRTSSTALQQNNENRGAGFIEHNGAQWLMRAVRARPRTSQHLKDVVVVERDGVPVRVADVADVGIGRELRNGAATQNGHEVVMSTVFMLIGENSRDRVARGGREARGDPSRRCRPASRRRPSTIAPSSSTRRS